MVSQHHWSHSTIPRCWNPAWATPIARPPAPANSSTEFTSFLHETHHPLRDGIEFVELALPDDQGKLTDLAKFPLVREVALAVSRDLLPALSRRYLYALSPLLPPHAAIGRICIYPRHNNFDKNVRGASPLRLCVKGKIGERYPSAGALVFNIGPRGRVSTSIRRRSYMWSSEGKPFPRHMLGRHKVRARNSWPFVPWSWVPRTSADRLRPACLPMPGGSPARCCS